MRGGCLLRSCTGKDLSISPSQSDSQLGRSEFRFPLEPLVAEVAGPALPGSGCSAPVVGGGGGDGAVSLPCSGRGGRGERRGGGAGTPPSSGCWVPPAPAAMAWAGEGAGQLAGKVPPRAFEGSVGSHAAECPRMPRGRAAGVATAVPCDHHRGLWAPPAERGGLQEAKAAQNWARRGIFLRSALCRGGADDRWGCI